MCTGRCGKLADTLEGVFTRLAYEYGQEMRAGLGVCPPRFYARRDFDGRNYLKIKIVGALFEPLVLPETTTRPAPIPCGDKDRPVQLIRILDLTLA